MYYRFLEKSEIFIAEGKRPWWHLAIAALCFTVTIVSIYFLSNTLSNDRDLTSGIALISLYSLVMGVRYAMIKHHHFDFVASQYKIEKGIGPFTFGKWKDFERLNYISVFNNQLGMFEVNLWYNQNKHFQIVLYDDIDQALELGEKLAKKLEIDLLDAAHDPRNSQWVDLD